MYLGVVLHHVVHEVAADEAAAARDDDVLNHVICIIQHISP